MSLCPSPIPASSVTTWLVLPRKRDPKTPLEQIAKDFGVHQTTLNTWMRRADVEVGTKPGVTAGQSDELRELKRRNRLLGLLRGRWSGPRRRASVHCFSTFGPTTRLSLRFWVARAPVHSEHISLGTDQESRTGQAERGHSPE